MIRVLGIDPGGTTGLADLQHSEDGWWLAALQVDTVRSVLGELDVLVRSPRPDVVAIERFVVNRRAGRSGSAAAGEKARNIIGAVTALCQEAGVPLVTYSASRVKAWATDKRLEAAGLLAPTRGLPHARDAARHALYAAVWRCGLPDPLSTKERT